MVTEKFCFCTIIVDHDDKNATRAGAADSHWYPSTWSVNSPYLCILYYVHSSIITININEMSLLCNCYVIWPVTWRGLNKVLFFTSEVVESKDVVITACLYLLGRLLGEVFYIECLLLGVLDISLGILEWYLFGLPLLWKTKLKESQFVDEFDLC